LLRFPNPGSTIGNFVAVYAAAFEQLNGNVVDLDDIVNAVVAANLATSSGYTGKEAVSRSTRQDRSRDPLYNQLKMYAELFRSLGWLHPTPKSSLNFTFTLLGAQLVAAGHDYLPLLRECLLGIAYPSHVLKVTGTYNIRPFALILAVMLHTGGILSRDEMILGPLSASTDRNADAIASIVNTIEGLRRNVGTTATSLADLAKRRMVQVNTLHNYTRWPLAAMRDCGWTAEVTVKFDNGDRCQSRKLTALGEAAAERIISMTDLRAEDVDRLGPEEKISLSLNAHYRMLDRAGFNLFPVAAMLEAARPTVASALKQLRVPPNSDVLFSPFQALGLDDIEATFPGVPIVGETRSTSRQIVNAEVTTGRGNRDHLFISPHLIDSERLETSDVATSISFVPLDRTRTRTPLKMAGGTGQRESGVKRADSSRLHLIELVREHGGPEAAAEAFAEHHRDDTQTEFYPLITHLFEIVGYRSDLSRAGVNYQRWDACVWVGQEFIPIEIKSPTEEFYLSTKAVRQALENKIVLLSRGGFGTRDLTSLIVGFRLPNARGDMAMLINDIFFTYGFRIGVIPLRALAALAARAIVQKVTIDPEQLQSLCGFLDV
jgi:hypothetical protein